MRSWLSSAGGMRSCSISRQRRIAEALQRRASLAASGQASAFRLVNRAADAAPGLAVDRYADVAIVHTDELEIAETWLPDLRAELDQLCATGYVKVHTRGLSQPQRPDSPAWGPPR